MKPSILVFLILLSLHTFGQQNKDGMVLEISPANIFISRGILYSIQGNIGYSFKDKFQVVARYNQTLNRSADIMSPNIKPNPYSKSSYAQLIFSTEIYNTENRIYRYRQTPRVSHAIKADIGINYFRQETRNSEYYTYDSTALGQRKAIKGKNTLSLTLGIQFQIREYKKDSNNVHLQRQHNFSLGAIFGLDYFLPAFIDIPGKYPTFYAPKLMLLIDGVVILDTISDNKLPEIYSQA